jgi:hypothetical protein
LSNRRHNPVDCVLAARPHAAVWSDPTPAVRLSRADRARRLGGLRPRGLLQPRS